MNFHTEIAHKLYVWNTKIDDIIFSPFDFIEAMHEKAPYKGKVFYQNLMLALPHHWGYKVRHDFFNEVWQYCEQKLSIIERIGTEPEAKAPEAIDITVTQTPLNYKEQALVYIFDLLAIDGKVPRKPNTEQYDKIALEAIGEKKNLKGDSFYRAVKGLFDAKYDLIKTKDLDNISARWYEILKQHSQNYELTRKYLIQQLLIRE